MPISPTLMPLRQLSTAWRRRARPGLPAAWWPLWGLFMALGLGLIVLLRLQSLLAAFETDARIVHRLLSQKAAQHDTMLATLNLLAVDGANPSRAAAPAPTGAPAAHDARSTAAAQAGQRLPALSRRC